MPIKKKKKKVSAKPKAKKKPMKKVAKKATAKKKQTYTDITVILDKSGSMSPLVKDTVGGFNEFLVKQQSVKGKADLTLIQFDTNYQVVHENRPIKDVPKLTIDTYRPGGMTALLDAVGRTITDKKKRFSSMGKNKPSQVLMVIITDGEENSSHEYKKAQIKSLIEDGEKEKWNFMFLGANQDSFHEAGAIGISQKMSADFSGTSKGIRCAFSAMSTKTASYRTTNDANSLTYSNADRKKLMDEDDS